jgi:DNA-binding NarL/FixJ family response regulator
MINSSARQERSPETTRVLLISDLPLRAAAIKEILGGVGHPFLIGEAEDRCAAHLRLLEREYDLIVIDVRWEKRIEKELVAEIFSVDFHSRILFFTDSAHNDFIGGYVGQGFWGFVSRSGNEASEVRMAVGKIFNDKNYISTTLLNLLTC